MGREWMHYSSFSASLEVEIFLRTNVAGYPFGAVFISQTGERTPFETVSLPVPGSGSDFQIRSRKPVKKVGFASLQPGGGEAMD